MKNLKLLAASKCMFTENGITYRGTICEVYTNKITITSGEKRQFDLTHVEYGTNKIPSEGCVSVPKKIKGGYLSKESENILSNKPRLLTPIWN